MRDPVFRLGALTLCTMLCASCSVPLAPVATVAPPDLPPEARHEPPPPVSVVAPVPVPSPVKPSAAPQPEIASLEDYKQAVALRIVQANPQHLFEGPPPPLLRSVVVLGIGIDEAGRPARVQVLRGNGQHLLEQLAVQSLHAASPLPPPGRLAARRRLLEFNETWLFREDGRFQLRTLAAVQSDGGS